jgi:tetratricopeptide (TPR) repeat protein
MPDPLRTDGTRALDADRDAKIEQLLLAGLDRYFAAQYEQAINVWTRVLLLDRSHPRARAYIERARSALAERQRQSEELLQIGVAAFERGDATEARRLIQAAIDGGAPSDEAFAVLGRLDRLEQPSPPPRRPRPREERRPTAGPLLTAPRPRPALGLAVPQLLLIAAVVVIGGAYTASNRDRAASRPFVGFDQETGASGAAPIARDARAPSPRPGTLALERARRLMAGGRLHDALSALDGIRPTDAEKADADRVRARIEHQLLDRQTAAGGKADRRRP